MIPAFRAIDRNSVAGEALPDVWNTLAARKIRFYRGELSMVAGPPGGGKSSLAFQYAVQSKAPGLYVSCDMGHHMTTRKIWSILTGRPGDDMELGAKEDVRSIIADNASHLWLAHETGPSLADLDDLIQAYIEVHAEPPAAMYVDNVMNVSAPGDSQATKDKKTCEILHQMAGRYETAVIALAHTFIKRGGAPYPASEDEIKGQLGELPGLILTVAADANEGVLRACPVKNRHGRPDPTGKDFLELAFDGPSGTLSDKAPRPAVATWGGNYYEKQEN